MPIPFMTPKKELEYFEKNSKDSLLYGQGTYAICRKWLDHYAAKGYETFTTFSKAYFSADVKKRKEIFGKQQFCAMDSRGRRLYVWRKDLTNGTIWILTGGRGRGTSYEYNCDDGKEVALYIEFVYFLLEKNGIDNTMFKDFVEKYQSTH